MSWLGSTIFGLINHLDRITDRAVIQLARTCTRLRYVDLACQYLDLPFFCHSDCRPFFTGCTQLTDLSVSELATLVKLRRIGLVRVVNLTDQAVFALSERQSSLERIHLSYCEQITIPAIHFLLQRLHKLTHLSLTGIPAFRRDELQRFCRTPPRVSLLVFLKLTLGYDFTRTIYPNLVCD